MIAYTDRRASSVEFESFSLGSCVCVSECYLFLVISLNCDARGVDCLIWCAIVSVRES